MHRPQITKLEVGSDQMIPVFVFDRGVWTCVGPCCRPTAPRRLHPHPQRAVIVPYGQTGTWDTSLVRAIRPNGPAVPRYHGATHGWMAPVERLRIAELKADVTLSNDVAHNAVGWHSLSIRELHGILEWYREAHVEAFGEWWRGR